MPPPSSTVVHPTGSPVSLFPRIILTAYVSRYLGEVGGVPTWDDGIAETRIVPDIFSWGSCGQLSTLTLRYELGASADGTEGQKYVSYVNLRMLHGAKIRLVDDVLNEEWFRGHLGFDEILVQASPDREIYTLTAYGPELLLKQKAVSGQWHGKTAVDDKELAGTATGTDRVRANAFATNLPVEFNPGFPRCSCDS